MAKQAPIVTPASKEPTWFNRHILTGAKIGVLPALAIAAAAPTVFGAATIASVITTGAIGGGVAGSYYGKTELEKDKLGGKVINPPSPLNEGTLNGFLNGLVVGASVITAIALAPTAPVWAIPAALGATVTAAFGLSYIQGQKGYAKMQATYNQAKTIMASNKEPEKGLLTKISNALPSVPILGKSEDRGEDVAEQPQPDGNRLENSVISGGSSKVEKLLNERSEINLEASR
ncbi:MAG: hypothetical protein MRY32_00395 [Rickettsiales bacterium]|nr:hypothetical protein [Rickettsiales bacterium]